MKDQDLILLIGKYKNDTLSPEEEEAFFSWYHHAQMDEVSRLLDASGAVLPGPMPDAFRAGLESKLDTADALEAAAAMRATKVRRLRIGWWAAAASLLLVGGLTYLLRRESVVQPPAPIAKMDVAPGRSGALLTLANGDVINLDSISNGEIAPQQGAHINKQNGQLNYSSGAQTATTVAYNTITVPAARQFKIVLEDGTEVWLNSGSALRYPTVFNGQERSVEISGEAYFEVAPRAQQPFHVKVSDGTEVLVLGTSFNVNAYTDEKGVRATLVSGSVLVNSAGNTLLLKPGQQAVAGSGLQLVKDANVTQAIAWKEGTFDFDKLDVATAMRQLARWYDLQVVYEKGIPDIRFYGEIGRNLKLSEVLEGLQASGLHCRLEEGHRLVVMP